MRVYNDPATTNILHQDLTGLLEGLRARRGFDAETLVAAKVDLLNRYMTDAGLKACVVATSGGIDSAVVLGLVARAAATPGSPIERVQAVLLPVHDPAATNQDVALERGLEVARACGAEVSVVDVSPAHAALKAAVDAGTGIEGEGWASGQLVAYARTPALYYTTSLLTQQGLPALLVGTTNRDEGAYLGYVGKAADGMVDLQLISDLHKSEVYAVARELQLPGSVIDAVPTGDMYDGRPDEEVFGATYDFVELYLLWLCLPVEERERLILELRDDARDQFSEMAAHLEHLHSYNAHKYLVGSPAVHLDVLQSAVPGGWK